MSPSSCVGRSRCCSRGRPGCDRRCCRQTRLSTAGEGPHPPTASPRRRMPKAVDVALRTWLPRALRQPADGRGARQQLRRSLFVVVVLVVCLSGLRYYIFSFFPMSTTRHKQSTSQKFSRHPKILISTVRKPDHGNHHSRNRQTDHLLGPQ